MPAIQAVLFDLGGTLLHYDQPPEHTLEALNLLALRAFVAAAQSAGSKVTDPNQAMRAVVRVAAAMEAKSARTMRSGSAENALREGLGAVGVKLSPAAWEAALAAYSATVAQHVQPVAGDAPAVLAELTAQSRTLGIVSNTMWSPALHDADLARFGMLEFLPIRVYSSSAGIAKPHPSIYRLALDQMDVAPAEAVFVGDRLTVDVAGPQKVGMRAVLVASPYRSAETGDVQPEARIETLAELPALLVSWDNEIERNNP